MDFFCNIKSCLQSLVKQNKLLFVVTQILFFFPLCPHNMCLSCDSHPAAGSYVALTVLGRPPGVPQIPLVEDGEDSDVEKREEEEKEEGAEVSSSSSPMARPASERCPLETTVALLPDGVKDK